MASLSLKSPWLAAEAIGLILLGVAALIFPILAGVAAALVLGWALLITGSIGVVSAVGARRHAHFGLSLLSAVIALSIGVLILLRPLAGAVGLSILIGVYLLLDGATLCALALDVRKRGGQGWGWVLASGVVDLALAGFIVALTAIGSALLIGVIVGVDLVAAGAGLLLATRLPRLSGSAKPA